MALLILAAPMHAAGGIQSEDVFADLEQEPRAALVVGWSAYRGGGDEFPPLGSAHRDAEIVAEQLSALGYQVISLTSYQTANGQIVSNGMLRENLFERMDRLARIFESRPDEGSLIFFFAGHGASAGGENYLISYESRLDDIAGTGIPLQAVVDKLHATRAKRKMLFIDACRNPVSPGVRSRNGQQLTFVPYLQSKGYQILFASEFGKQSTEYEELDGGHGAFSYFLWQGLRGPGARNGIITFDSLADYVEHEVRNFTLNRSVLQEPHRAGESHGEFFIAKAPPGTDMDVVSPPLAAAAALQFNSDDLPGVRRTVLAFDTYVENMRRDSRTLAARTHPLAGQNIQFAEQQLRMAGETYLLAEQAYLVARLPDEALVRYREAIVQYQRAERNFQTAYDIVAANMQFRSIKRVLEDRRKSMDDVAAVLDMTSQQRHLLEQIRDRYELRLRIEPIRPSADRATSTLYFERYLDGGIPVGLGLPPTAALHLTKHQGHWRKPTMEWLH